MNEVRPLLNLENGCLMLSDQPLLAGEMLNTGVMTNEWGGAGLCSLAARRQLKAI